MARTFDGVDDQIACGTNAELFLSTFTAAAWIKFASNFTAERVILTKFDAGFLGKLFLDTGAGGRQNSVFAYVTRATTAMRSDSVADTLTAGVWNFVCSTCDGTNAPKIYTSVMGSAASEVAYFQQVQGSGAFNGNTAATCRVGGRDAADAVYWNGEVAEVGLWDRVLSLDEIKAKSLGFAPSHFQRGQLLYLDVLGRRSPELNMAPGGRTNGTVTGTAFSDHPRIFNPRNPFVSTPNTLATGHIYNYTAFPKHKLAQRAQGVL